MKKSNTPHLEKVKSEESTLILRDIINKYLRQWKWFVLGTSICIGIAFIYLRYANKVYLSHSSILIKDDKNNGGVMSEMALFQDMGLLGANSEIESEIEILTSRTIIEQVAEKLELNKLYIAHGSKTGFQEEEMFIKSPVKIKAIKGDSVLYNKKTVFKLKILNENSFSLSELKGKDFPSLSFGKKVTTKIGEISFEKSRYFKSDWIGRNFTISVLKIDDVVTKLKKQIKVEPISNDGKVLTISLKGGDITKINSIIDELVNQHEIDAIKDKNEIAENTGDFINERMELISQEINEVDNKGETFKTENNLVGVEQNAGMYLTKESEAEKAIIETNIQSSLAKYINNYINQQIGNETLLPANLGLEDPSIAALIGEYNRTVLKRNRILEDHGEQNPGVLKLESQLEEMKAAVVQSLKSIQSTFQFKLQALEEKENLYKSKIASVPGFEKEFREILRQQQIKETLYLYLMQKREENEIALVGNVGNTKVIDPAYSDGKPVSPKKEILYIGALFLGILIPFIIIYLSDLLDNKVHSAKDIKKYNLPHVGNIPINDIDEKLVAVNNPRSIISEAFRILRTNVSYLFSEIKPKGNTIMVTSTIASEGKTFISLNLAHTLALTGKKIVVIGLDLRAPKLLQYMNLPTNKKGVTDYLINPDLSYSDVVFPLSGTENLFMIPSGSIPPNPSELLMKPRLQELIEDLKKEYDYIIFDTAPVSLVTDTLITAKIADVSLYVVRANRLDKRMLEVPISLYEEQKLNNMAVVLNGVNLKGQGYGYGYGYGYGAEVEIDNKKRFLNFHKKS